MQRKTENLPIEKAGARQREFLLEKLLN